MKVELDIQGELALQIKVNARKERLTDSQYVEQAIKFYLDMQRIKNTGSKLSYTTKYGETKAVDL